MIRLVAPKGEYGAVALLIYIGVSEKGRPRAMA